MVKGARSIATVCLTRGYPGDSLKYNQLIARNRAIWEFFDSATLEEADHLILHEGNISPGDQQLIQELSSPLDLTFLSIEEFFKAFQSEHLPEAKVACPETDLSRRFGVGYRTMCAFWIREFIDYLTHYGVVFRIDEDCVLQAVESEALVKALKSGEVGYVSGAAFKQKDFPDVTLGFEKFVKRWKREHPKTSRPRFNLSPYTNVSGWSMEILRNSGVIEFLDAVRRTGCVRENRWGDLPVWGAALSMYKKTLPHDLSADIKYWHASHSIEVH